jgi:hypothetical protein
MLQLAIATTDIATREMDLSANYLDFSTLNPHTPHLL